MQPAGNGWRHFLLRAAADINPDVTPVKFEFAVVRACHMICERPRGGCRHQVIVSGIYVEHRAADITKINDPAIKHQLTANQGIALEEVSDKFAKSPSCLVGAVRYPSFHPGKGAKALGVVSKINEIDIFF